MPHHGSGPIPARVMLVGEAWGSEEDQSGEPFVGYSGQELNRMLHDAGLMRSECFVSNLVNYRPPDNDLHNWVAFSKKERTSQHVEWRGWYVLPIIKQGYENLMAEIETVKPNVIVAFGNYALHALNEHCIKMTNRGPSGILKWRGSHLRMDVEPNRFLKEGPIKVIPSIHPAAVLREWSQRWAAVNDLRRVKRLYQDNLYSPPDWKFIIRPSISTVLTTLQDLLNRASHGDQALVLGQRVPGEALVLDLDLETRAGHIACCGISWSKTEALIIPFMCVENYEGYWVAEEEAQIIFMLYQLLRHPRVLVRWQNGLYDAQYIYRWWHFIPRGWQDTMISQHSIFSDQPKSLAYQASIYADWYVYWKDEGKTWSKKMGEDQLWFYNGEDCVYTREVGEVELETNAAYAKRDWPAAPQVHAFQQAMFYPVLQAMIRGVKIIKEQRNLLAGEVQEQISLREAVIEKLLGHSINPRSPKQMMALFYDDLGEPEIRTRAKKGQPSRRTLDDDALQKIAARNPLLKPLVNCIADVRTMGILLSNFILAKLDTDGRMRCSYNIGGSESGKSAPKTYRLSSSENAFDSGTNLQNVPSEKSKSLGKAKQRGHLDVIGDPYSLPNVRSLFGPDPGYTFFDTDLERADLHVFVWEIDDPIYKEVLKRGVDAHLFHVYLLDGQEPPPLEELIEGHPKYQEHRAPRKYKREFSKVFCHAVDYYGQAKTLAQHTGWTVHETERARKKYLSSHPKIEPYWEDLRKQITSRRYVENKFGYRWYIFDRIEQVLPEAIAWIPQSTVSIVINRIWMNLFQGVTEAQWNFDIDHLLKLVYRGNALNIQVLMQVHDSLAGQFPTFRKQACLDKIKELSSITVPYDDPLIIPTSIGTSETSWGEC